MKFSYYILVIIVLIELIRYIPQLKKDFINRKRPHKIKISIEVKSIYIWGLNILIFSILIFKFLTYTVSKLYIIFGFPVFLIGILVGLLGLFQLGSQYHEEILRYSDEDKLEKDGIYSLVRHPLRLGLFLEILGISIMSMTYISFIMLVILMIFQYYRTEKEEKLLFEQFGNEQTEYANQVPKYNILLGLKRKILSRDSI